MGRKTRQNKITSPELIAQINPKNIRLMNDFLEYLRSIGKADSTVKAYTSDLYIFFVWVLQNADNKYFPEISKRDIISYQNQRQCIVDTGVHIKNQSCHICI